MKAPPSDETPATALPAASSPLAVPLEIIATAHRVLDRIEGDIRDAGTEELLRAIAQLRDSALQLKRGLPQADAKVFEAAVEALSRRL